MDFTIPYMRDVMHTIGEKYGASNEKDLLTGERERERRVKRERERERERGGRRDARDKRV